MERATLFVHTLTLIHAVGAVVVFAMAAYVQFIGEADDLATTPGARQLVDWTGGALPIFFVALGVFLASLAWGSHHRQPWSWPAALAAYSVGVVGSLLELVWGHTRYAASLAINGAVVALLLLPSVRARFRP